MRLGWYISGAGHIALILAVLFGGLFAGDRIPEAVVLSEVSILSEEEYAALIPPGVAPDTQTDAPEVATPDEDAAPEVPDEDAAPDLAAPRPIDAPETPEAPEFEVETPVPNAVVVDDAPTIPAPPSDQDGTVAEPDQVAAPAPRVAPVPQVAPPPEAETGPEVIPETAPAPEAPPEDPVEEDTPTAPEEASDRIVTEAEEEKTYAPASSKRPRARPARPRRVAEPAPEPEPQPEAPRAATDDAVAAALAEEAAPSEAPVRRGPPLTGGEKDAFRLAVGQCWNVGSLSTEALGTTVVVAFEMSEDGKPVSGSIRMVSSSGGSDLGARSAFDAARRAILRCGARGFNLPVEKYDQWREIEATFNPQGMQFR